VPQRSQKVRVDIVRIRLVSLECQVVVDDDISSADFRTLEISNGPRRLAAAY
jgi:hypothetical protein